MLYEVLIKPSALKESKRIPDKAKEQIRQIFKSLSTNPRPQGIKKLKGREDFFRVRIGNYRVLYTIQDREKKIHILSILHRKEAYR